MSAPDRMSGASLETSAQCQLKCPLCFLRSYTERPEPSLMPLAVARAAAPHLAGLESVDLTGWGEPLLNPRLFEIIAIVREHFSGRLAMTTNGLLLDRKAMSRLIDFELDTVCVSVDAAGERAYNRARPGGDFSRLMRSLEEFATLREERGAKTPRLFATFLLRRSALSELADFTGLAAAHGLDGVVFQLLTGVFSDSGLGEATHRAYYGNDFDEGLLGSAVGRAKQAAPSGFIIAGPERIFSAPVGGCGGFDLSRPFITSSGLVSVCCAMAYPCALIRRDGRLERTASVVFGDVLETPLPAIWEDPAYRKVRAEIQAGRVNEACGDCIALYMKPGEVFQAR